MVKFFNYIFWINLVYKLLHHAPVLFSVPHIHPINQRIRLTTEEKAKVVAAVWGTDFIQFLAAQAILPRSNWKNRMISSFSVKSTEAKQLARQGIE